MTDHVLTGAHTTYVSSAPGSKEAMYYDQTLQLDFSRIQALSIGEATVTIDPVTLQCTIIIPNGEEIEVKLGDYPNDKKTTFCPKGETRGQEIDIDMRVHKNITITLRTREKMPESVWYAYTGDRLNAP